jgi:SAM-dependent methyltransferase
MDSMYAATGESARVPGEAYLRPFASGAHTDTIRATRERGEFGRPSVADGTEATVEERIRHYILDGSNADLRRLLSISQLTAETARAAFRRIGIQDGWNVIDCGCGPIGALAVLAEVVGPTGRVVGVDLSEPAVQRARAVAAELQLDQVEVMVGDIGEFDAATLGGPFDLAFSRLFLMHQADLAHVLTRIAGLLRPGGWLITQEPLSSPPPRSHPHMDGVEAFWALLYKVMESSGARPRAVDDLPRTARAVGFEVVQANGFFLPLDPELGFEIHAATLAAGKERALKAGAATEEEIDETVRALRAAKNGDYEWVSSPFFLDLALRKTAPQ